MTDRPPFPAEPVTKPKGRTLEGQIAAIVAAVRRIERTQAEHTIILGNLYRAQTAGKFEQDKLIDDTRRRLNALELPGSGKR